jgi:prophage antirepressor-like protein
MQNLVDLFAEKKIRAVWDNRTCKWWFSVADICAAINDCDYKAARNYWKWLKGTWTKEYSGLVSVTNRMDFPTATGTAHFSDAMDIKGVLHLIMAYPSPKAEPLRLWFVELLAENPIITEQFTQIGEKSHSKRDEKRPTRLQTITVRDVTE